MDIKEQLSEVLHFGKTIDDIISDFKSLSGNEADKIHDMLSKAENVIANDPEYALKLIRQIKILTQFMR